MPFLRAGGKPIETKQIREKIPAVVKITPRIKPIDLQCDDRQILIDFPEQNPKDDKLLKAHLQGSINKEKGTLYERSVGSLYEEIGYQVEYNGINKGAWDGTIDLICTTGRYTVLVQCKYYETAKIKRNDIYQFYGAYSHYAKTHPKEVVQGAYWTSQKLDTNSEVFRAIIELGISLYDDCVLQQD